MILGYDHKDSSLTTTGGPLREDDLGREAASRRPQTDWAQRDAAIVWHGFTQMKCYADNSPVIVERAEGRELIDVAGRRYLDAISSLWVTTLGHRVPELDQALLEQLGRVAHSTMLGNGNRIGDTIGSLSLGASGFGTHVFDPLRFPVIRAPSFSEPHALRRAAELDTKHDAHLARRVCAAMVRRGVLSRSLGPVITLAPPLTITAEEIERIVAALGASLEEIAR